MTAALFPPGTYPKPFAALVRSRLMALWPVLVLCGTLVSATLCLAADHAASLYKQGQEAETRQDYEAAYSAYAQAYQAKPKDIAYRSAAVRMRFMASMQHVHRGQQLREGGKLQEALAEFQKAASIDPASFIAQQESRRTKVMIDAAASKGGTAAIPPELDRMRKQLEAADHNPIELAAISNAPITLNMTEEAKSIYQVVAKLAGINVLVDPDVPSRKIHVELHGVSLSQALSLIALESKTFWQPMTPNTIFVTADNVAKRKDLEPSILKTFYLTNALQNSEMQDIVNVLRTILDVSKLTPLPTQGAIVVRGTPSQIALAEKLISDLDKPRAEVVVEVAVMQIDRQKIRDLGVQLPTSTSVALTGSNNNSTTSNTSSTSSTSSTTSNTLSNIANGVVSLNTLGSLTANDFSITVGSASASFLASQSNSRLIQNPQIRAMDGQKATLKIGERVPVATGSFQPGLVGGAVNSLVSTQFQYIDVGVNIDITPTVHGTSDVTLKVSMDISAVDSQVSIGGITEPVIGQRRIDHTIRLKEGEINIIGGLLENSDVKALSGYPGLMNVPILKYLFGTEHTDRRQSETVFVLIPRIVRSQEITPFNLKPLDVGTANNIELRAAHPPSKAPVNAAQPQAPAATPAAVQPPAPLSGMMRPATPAAIAPVPAPAVQSAEPRASAVPATPAAMPSAPPADSGSTGWKPTPAPLASAVQPISPNSPMPAAVDAAARSTVSSSGVVLGFSPRQVSAGAGQTFTVDLVVSEAQNLSAAAIRMVYDPGKLEFVSAAGGSFLGEGGRAVNVTQKDDPLRGTVQLAANRPPDAPGVSGQGPVVTVTFKAKAVGQPILSISGASLMDSKGQAIAASGTKGFINIRSVGQ